MKMLGKSIDGNIGDEIDRFRKTFPYDKLAGLYPLLDRSKFTFVVTAIAVMLIYVEDNLFDAG